MAGTVRVGGRPYEREPRVVVPPVDDDARHVGQLRVQELQPGCDSSPAGHTLGTRRPLGKAAFGSLSGEFGPRVRRPPGPIRNARSTPVSSLATRTLPSGVT